MMSIAAEARSAGGRPGVRAVILDWAGTTVDHGSRAPVAAIRRGFAAHGVTLTEEEARGPMGMAKRDHIASLLADPSVADRWMAVTGDRPGPAVLDLLKANLKGMEAGHHAWSLVRVSAEDSDTPGTVRES